jgi:hypothetical protein
VARDERSSGNPGRSARRLAPAAMRRRDHVPVQPGLASVTGRAATGRRARRSKGGQGRPVGGLVSPGPVGYNDAHRRLCRRSALRRGGRVVECTALEMRHTGNRIGGSNPSLSASLRFPRYPILRQGTTKAQ